MNNKFLANSDFFTGAFPAEYGNGIAGVFDLKISALGINGCLNSLDYVVKNINNPAGGFESPGSTTNLCTNTVPLVPLKFGISNWGLNSLDTKYTVNFGDGSSELLTQIDFKNSIYYNDTSPENSDAYIVEHTYIKGSCDELNNEYKAILIIENACDQTEITISNIKVLDSSIADFDFDGPGCVDNLVTFNNKITLGDRPDCNKIGDITWNFGDKNDPDLFTETNVSTPSNPSHSYSESGTYEVILTVRTFCGESIYRKEICIEPEITPTFSVDNAEGCIPLNVTATNTTNQSELCRDTIPVYDWIVNYNPDNCGNSEDWEFVNDTDASSENPEFIFKNPGKYTLIQRIITGCGTETAIKIIDVKKPPTAIIQEIDDTCGSVTFTPIATVENCTSNTSGINYNWTFIGGTPANSTALNPGDITYTNPGV